jgi:hypothetical protein
LEELARGARALDAFLRPYPMFTAGTPIHLSFDYDSKERTFRFRFQNAGHVEASAHQRKATEIFLPFLHFGHPIHRAMDGEIKQISDPESTSGHKFFDVQVSDGEWSYDADTQVLHYYHCEPDIHYYQPEPQNIYHVVNNHRKHKRILHNFQMTI